MRKAAFTILSLPMLVLTLFLSKTVAQFDDDHSNTPDGATRIYVDNAGPLGLGTGGKIDYIRDVDYFEVQVREAGELIIVSSSGFEFDDPTDLVGQLRDSNDVHLATSTNDGRGPNFRIVYTVTPGTYYIRVTELNRDYTGPYWVYAYFTPIPEDGDAYPDLKELPELEEAVRCVAYSPNGDVLVAGDNSDKIHVWDPITGDTIKTLEGNSDAYGDIRSIAFSPDGTWCAAGTGRRHVPPRKGGYLLVWKQLEDIWGDPRPWTNKNAWGSPQKIELKQTVRSVAFSFDSEFLACGTDGEKVYIYEKVENGEDILWKESNKLEDPGDNVTSIAWHPTKNMLAIGCEDAKVRLWREPFTADAIILSDTASAECIVFSPDGKKLAAGLKSGRITLFLNYSDAEDWSDPEQVDERSFFDPKHENGVTSLTFHPRGHVLASCGADGDLSFWDMRMHSFLSGATKLEDARISSIAFNPLGNAFAIGTEGVQKKAFRGYKVPPRVYQFEYTGTTGFTNAGNFSLKIDALNLVSKVAYSGNTTYFVLNLQSPTLIDGNVENPIYGDCSITLDLPDVQQLPERYDPNGENDRLDNPLYFMYPLETPRQRIAVVRAEKTSGLKFQIITSVIGGTIGAGIGFAIGTVLPGGGNLLGASAGILAGQLAARVIGSVAGNLIGVGLRSLTRSHELLIRDKKAEILAETADPFFLIQKDETKESFPLPEYRVLFLIKDEIKEIGITVEQSYRLKADGPLYVAKYTHTWDLKNGSWSADAPPAQSMSLADYPPFQELPPEEQVYLLRHFGSAAKVNAKPLRIPEETSLLPNYPNPFNPETWIPYQLANPADVTLTIYDIKGHVVRDLDLGHQRAGMYHSRSRAAYWDGRNQIGEPVASGLYFYRLKAGDFVATRKMLIRK